MRVTAGMVSLGVAVSHGLLHCHLQQAGSVAAARSTINSALILIPDVQGTVTPWPVENCPRDCRRAAWQLLCLSLNWLPGGVASGSKGLVQTRRQGAQCL